MSSPSDTKRWIRRLANITTSSGESIRISYNDCPPPSSSSKKGTILLIHGFPQTSYQFRHVIPLFSEAGYRVIAPDYRGAGQSSKPVSGYTKSQMAEDLHILLHDHLGIKEKVHIVGHDIGAMIAIPYAQRYTKDVASLVWGEGPPPGSSIFEAINGSPNVFHFVFHQILDLPEFLIAGKEREYLKHFFDKQSHNSGGITPEDLDHYTLHYSQPGAMRAGINVYRAFGQDAKEYKQWVEENGKLKVPSLVMMGGEFLLAPHTETLREELHEQGTAEQLLVQGSGHYIAEEQPEAFVEGILQFLGKHGA